MFATHESPRPGMPCVPHSPGGFLPSIRMVASEHAAHFTGSDVPGKEDASERFNHRRVAV